MRPAAHDLFTAENTEGAYSAAELTELNRAAAVLVAERTSPDDSDEDRYQITQGVCDALNDAWSADATADLLIGRVHAMHAATRSAAALLGQRGGRIGGRARSHAKTRAARANGKRGGRPRKPTTEED